MSLIWDTKNDLDLHVVSAINEHISFAAKQDNAGGFLDVDWGPHNGSVGAPVENVFWASPMRGRYQIFVHHYGLGKFSQLTDVPYKVRLKIGSQPVKYFSGVATYRRRYGDLDLSVFSSKEKALRMAILESAVLVHEFLY